MSDPSPVPTLEAARDLINARGLAGAVSPARLLASAKEMQLGLAETLKLLAELLSGGQGQGPFPETIAALEADKK